MRKLFLVPLFGICISYTYAQTNVKDSLKQLLQKETEDTSRVLLLADLSYEYIESKPDTMLSLALEALSLARQIGFEKGEAVTLNRIGNAFTVSGNYPKALESLLQALKINEKINNADGIQRNLNNIGLVYGVQGDYRQALDYSLKAKYPAEKINNKRFLSILLGNIAFDYYHLKQFDSARLYAQQSYNAAYEIDYPRTIGTSLTIMGNINYETGQNPLAAEYYRSSIPYSKKAENYLNLSDTYLGMARVFEKTGQADSSLFYAKQSLIIAREKGFTQEILDASSFLFSYYRNRPNADSAFFYLDVAKTANDSLFSQQKNKQLQSLVFDEKLRQADIAAAALKAKEKRNHNLQYAAMALGLITFIILFLLLSHSIIANQKLIRFLGVISLLIVFEFINLYIHPYLSDVTHDSPLIMLLVMVCIAALLVPLHHRLEKWILHRLVEKNKRIRLAAAKKTIANLE